MLLKFFLSFLALSSKTFAIPLSRKYFGKNVSFESSVREKLTGPPAGWVNDDSAKLDKETSMISLRIHLAHQNMDKFHKLAMNIATPGHELYGVHLMQEEIDSMIAPKNESRDLVMQWLDSVTLGEQASLSSRTDSIIVQASISQIEKLLNAQYSAFVQMESGQSVLRTLEYSIPDALESHVDMVQPTTFFGLKPQRTAISSNPVFGASIFDTEGKGVIAGCTAYINGRLSQAITPECLSNLYNFTSATSYTNGLIGIAGFLEEYPSFYDLAQFMKNYTTKGDTVQTITCTHVNEASNIACPQNQTSGALKGSEANLDVQYARAITDTIPNVFYSTGGSPPWLGTGTNTNEPYLEFLDYLLSLPATSLPNTLSISYGDDEATVPLDYATNVCNLFSQLGARGVSVLVASGDSGAGATCSLNNQIFFTTSFPASCPWVTTVGGTNGYTPEAAWSGSGGGFSEVFGRPGYQNATVNHWLTTDTTHTSVVHYFNSSGRAYPDVSAQATNFAIVKGGLSQLLMGTSCATPTFASLVQLINSDRLANGKTGLGFLNPWLYSNATAGLTDITSGYNAGCYGPNLDGKGFYAVPGWDPVTGLGTPIYTSLLKISQAT